MKRMAEVLLALFLAPVLGAAEPDFFLAMSQCQLTVAALKAPGGDLLVKKGDAPIFSCSRRSMAITCGIRFEDTTETEAHYVISLDSPPVLTFGAANGSEFVVIDLNTRAGVTMSRVLSDSLGGTKVCSGTYLTQQEVDAVAQPK